MDAVQKAEPNGLLYRLNAGVRFRIEGQDAQNDGLHADLDIGYQSLRYANRRLSLETGSTLDLFGETEHLGAYLQFNYHSSDRLTFSLRTIGAGVNDDKEGAASDPAVDSDDLGGLFEADLIGAYRLDRNFILGLRIGYNLQAYGEDGTDQGTQHSLSTLANLAYQF